MNFTLGQRVTIDGLADDTAFALTNGRTGTVVEVRRLMVAVRLDVPITMADVREVFGPDGEMFDMAEDAGEPDEGHVIAMTPKFLTPVTVPGPTVTFADQGGPMC